MSESLRVSVLGSSGSYASPRNPCTGFLVRGAGAAVLLDCGPGTLGPLQSFIDPCDLDAVVITHCHPDHWMELPVLRNVFTYFCPVERMPVYGTARTREMHEAVTAAPERDGDPIEWTVIDSAAVIDIGGQRWSFSRTDHPVETLAVRVDADTSTFAFTSDTGPAWKVGELGSGIDVAFCEASHLSSLEGRGIPHTSARQAGEAARAAGVDRLVLTHLVPGSDPEAHLAEAADSFGREVQLAEPGITFDI